MSDKLLQEDGYVLLKEDGDAILLDIITMVSSSSGNVLPLRASSNIFIPRPLSGGVHSRVTLASTLSRIRAKSR